MMHESNDLTLILNIKMLNIKSLTLHINKINKANIEIGEKCRKNRGYMYKITCTRAVNQPSMLKEVSNEYYAIVL